MNVNARSVVDDCDDVSSTMLVYSRALATQCQTMPNSVSCSSGVSRPDTPMLSSKVLSQDRDHFANLAVDAILG